MKLKFPAFERIELKETLFSSSADLPLSKIVPDKNQSRKTFDETALRKLASSIEKYGVLEPILVEKISDRDEYKIIAGERRWRAAKIAKLENIPAIVRCYEKADKMAVALIENIQREDLNSLEEAQAIKSLLEECNLTHEQIADNIGRSRTSITNLLRLLKLEDRVKGMLIAGLLEMGHARALLAISKNQQIEAADLIVEKKLSVREAERLVRRMGSLPSQKRHYVDINFEKEADDFGNRLSKQISKKVNLHFKSNGKGRVVIHFESIEEAKWLVENLRC